MPKRFDVDRHAAKANRNYFFKILAKAGDHSYYQNRQLKQTAIDKIRTKETLIVVNLFRLAMTYP
jgi:hypothetical protein